MKRNAIALIIGCSFTFGLYVTRAGTPGPKWWSLNPTEQTAASSLDAIFAGNAISWKIISGQFRLAHDAQLNAPVLTVITNRSLVLEGQTRYDGPCELRARVRLRTDAIAGPTAFFYIAQTNAKYDRLYLSVAATKGYDTINAAMWQDGKILHDTVALSKTMDWTPQFSNNLEYRLRAYQKILPGWEENYRARIESAMARLPGLEDKWADVRIQFRKGLVRAWIDDRLVATKEDPALDPQGTLRIDLAPGVQLASYTVAPWQPAEDFHPIALAGYANTRGFVDPKSLPPAGQLATVEGIPFEFPGVNPEGNDHIDVGESLFRQANSAGYLPAGPGVNGRWLGAAMRDPARIQVRIPFAHYENLYLIAAADGEENSVPLVSAMFYRPGAGYTETFEARVPLTTAKSGQQDPSPYPLPQGERESKIGIGQSGRPSPMGDRSISSPPLGPELVAEGLGGEDKGEGYLSVTAKPLPVTLGNGKKLNLWLVKIPLDPSRLTAFADLDIIEIEFTKKAHQYRSYPDPISYGFHQGDRPSSVHIYAATLSESPFTFTWNPDRFGHVWTAPEVAAYTGTLTNRSKAEMTGKFTVTTRSYDGSEETKQEQAIKIAAGAGAQAKFSLPVKLNGYHDVVATLQLGDKPWTEKRSFVRLAPDTRSPRWTEGKGVMFGYWSYHGGHYTPKVDHIVRLMTMAGARQAMHHPSGISAETQALVDKHWGIGQGTAYYVAQQEWAGDQKPDPAKVEAFKKEITQNVDKWEKDVPPQFRTDGIYFFAEPHITSRLTAGNWPEYWNGEPFQYTDEEKQRLRVFMGTARIASEHYRATMPTRKLFIPWGDPGFAIPLLRAGFPTNRIDGCGIDVPNFERLPEMQLHDNAVHRVYELRKEFEKAGIPSPYLQYCEGAFVPTEPGAVTWREQMDIYNRWSLINMAYGVKRFYSGWFAFDCGNYYGAEHYGGCGIQRRIPYCDPKPAYAAFATMTDKLNEANFDGWLKTGSLTTFCLRFKHETRGHVYALWTVRGKRPVTLSLKADAKAKVTDTMNNAKEFATQDKKITVMTDPSVIYVTDAGEIVSAEAGAPDNSDVQPADSAKPIADLADGSWTYTSRRDEIYENNHWGFYPYAGKFSARVEGDTTYPSPYPLPQALRPRAQGRVGERETTATPSQSGSPFPTGNGKISSPPLGPELAAEGLGGEDKGEGNRSHPTRVLVSELEKQPVVRELMPWYNVLKPKKPVLLPHAPSHIGLWVRGASDWGRVIYILRDARGERWISIGTKDDYNCDDVHSWASFNFDGWRYLRFELPGHFGWDNFRKYGTTWWRSDFGDTIVDLPLNLEEIIVEQRSHILYVNDVQPVASDQVAFGKLYVEYASSEDATPEAVRLSKLRMPLPKEKPNLPNPIAEMQRDGVSAPTKLLKLTPPEHYYDGTRMHVHFQEAPGAKAYHLWVGAYPGGRGAVNLVPTGIKNGDLVTGLRPKIKLYYWITYTDAQDKVSKPSPVHEEVTVDNFKEK